MYDICMVCISTIVSALFLGVGNKKFFLLMLGGCDPCTKSIRLDLLLRKSSIVGTHDLGGVPVESGKLLIELFNYVFQVKAPLQIGLGPDGEYSI